MSIWQTKDWWKMLMASKQAESIFDIWGVQVEKRSIGMWQYGLFIIGLDYNLSWIKNNEEDVEKYLVELSKKENALFLQVEILNYSWKLKDKFFDLSKFNFSFYKKFINEYTAVINLEKTEDEILTEMKPKWRYNIKLARKKGIEVKVVEKTEENIKLYYELMLETTSRDNYSWHNLNYYINFLNIIKSSKLLLAYKDDEVIAWGIFIFEEDVSIYYYWASTSKKEYRNMMAPYLVQWEAIKIAKSFGSKFYDFLWIAPIWVKNHPLSWVTNFKSKFTQDFRKVSEW
jgi:lipid II:glycine glycyltransferase (peptidoglycan interpeptide bridge formation enzyme)